MTPVTHKFKPETTNGGHCFSDCTCGWAGGVYPGRVAAREAWECHYDHRPVPAHVPATIWVAPRSGGYTPKPSERVRCDPPPGRGASSIAAKQVSA